MSMPIIGTWASITADTGLVDAQPARSTLLTEQRVLVGGSDDFQLLSGLVVALSTYGGVNSRVLLL